MARVTEGRAAHSKGMERIGLVRAAHRNAAQCNGADWIGLATAT